MAQVARLNIDLVARTAKFTAGLKSAKSSLTAFQSQVSGMITAAKGLIGAYVGMRAVGAIKNFVKSNIEAGDALATVSDKLGIAASDLIVLRQAAREYANVEGESLNTSLTKFAKVISEAASGGKEANKVFTDLHLNAKTLKSIGVEKAFEAVADKISKIPNPMDRVNAATKLFGRSGAELVPLLAAGSGAIAAMRKELEDLGIKLSAMDLQALASSADKLDRLGALFDVIKLQLTAGIMPALQVVANGFVSMGTEGEKAGSGVRDMVMSINVALAATSQTMADLKRVFLGWQVLAVKMSIAKLEIPGFGDPAKLLEMRKRLNIFVNEIQTIGKTDWAAKFFADMEKMKAKWEAELKGKNAPLSIPAKATGAVAGAIRSITDRLVGTGKADAKKTGIMGVFAQIEQQVRSIFWKSKFALPMTKAKIAESLDLPALQKGDPGIQAMVKQSRTNNMAELVSVEKNAAKDIKMSESHLRQMRDDLARGWAGVGIVAF